MNLKPATSNLITRFWPIVLWITANGLILAPVEPLRPAAALVLLAFVPGWVWLRYFDPPVSLPARVIVAMGLSLALTVVSTMAAVYLPGPLSHTPLLLVINGVILAGLVTNRSTSQLTNQLTNQPTPYLLITLAALLLLAAALRLPRLGYAEFHEDEAEALMLGVRLFQGEDYALFLHRKGPAQMLLPVAFWLSSGHLTETLARLPFALSSILSVGTLFLLGRRWFNGWVGLVAGLLWAVNGYSIAFGRMVQYQALIFFLGPLAIYLLYLAWREQRPRLQIAAALLLAVSLLAHFDALLLLPVAAFLFYQGLPPKKLVVMPLLAALLFIGLLTAFYLPYVLDPEFQNTTNYLTESRIKPGLLYNNLNLLGDLDKDYSSHFYLPLLVLGLLSAMVAGWKSRAPHPIAHIPCLTLFLLLLTTVIWPELWQVNHINLALLPWLAALAWLWFRADGPGKTAWLLAGAPLIGYVFLVDDPRTHLYILYPGAALLTGAGYNHLRLLILDFRLSAAIRYVIMGVIAIWVGLIVTYEAAIFLNSESALSRLRAAWDGSAWETVYDDLPPARSYFGYPKREGWKVIGALRAQGQFRGDFRSVNEDFIVPIWYSYGKARSCYDTPAQLFVRVTDAPSIPNNKTDYTKAGVIWRENQARLEIYSAGAANKATPQDFALENYAGLFDAQTTPGQFAQQNEPGQRVEAQFGPAIKFTGFDLPETTVAAGDTLHVNLYWQALAEPGDNYRAFVHLTDGTTLWGQQDEAPACRLPTTVWRAGQRAMGQFRLPIRPDTPPGRYPLIIGLYQADTLERLRITGGAGQPGDDFLWLGDVTVIK